MAINFPTSLDNFTNPSSGNTLDSPSHSLQHSDINDAVEALEAKLGVGASPAGSATSGQVLTASTGGTTTWSTLPTSGALVQIIPSSVSVGSGSGSADSNGFVTFTGASTVTLNGIFSSTYKNYVAFVKLNSQTSDGSYGWRLAASGTPTSTSYFTGGLRISIAGAITGQAGSNVSYFWLGDLDVGNTERTSSMTHFILPNVAVNTHMYATGFMTNTVGDYFACQNNGNQNDATSFDGAQLYVTAGNMTGTIAIYAYRN